MIRILQVEYGDEPIVVYFREQIQLFYEEKFGSDIEVIVSENQDGIFVEQEKET
ncbi:hypothetical protein [Aneurinibacillus uraniidurans]|uniref:hypothetical protein n=1 Tax=Aneurinibacillus uraniidurans TaxID=2966586 RepID=UPI00234B16CF|nr:hypothetical protein [Aneurinibacillus sp. B1]WCN36626.1 hypothetical protein PO771_12170 [Aneurinibacillus sp. B1]